MMSYVAYSSWSLRTGQMHVIQSFGLLRFVVVGCEASIRDEMDDVLVDEAVAHGSGIASPRRTSRCDFTGL